MQAARKPPNMEVNAAAQWHNRQMLDVPLHPLGSTQPRQRRQRRKRQRRPRSPGRVEILQHYDACEPMRERFRRLFPNGAKVNITNARKAMKAKLPLYWAADRLLTDEAAKRWYSAVAKAEDNYKKAERAENRVYEKTVKLARRKWLTANTEDEERKAYAAYEKINRSAVKAESKALAAADKARFEALARAFVDAVGWMEARQK